MEIEWEMCFPNLLLYAMEFKSISYWLFFSRRRGQMSVMVPSPLLKLENEIRGTSVHSGNSADVLKGLPRDLKGTSSP